MNRTVTLIAAALLCSASFALAHGPKGNAVVGLNGGQLADTENGHLELVVAPAELTIFVSDLQEAPLPSAAMTGRAIIQVGAKQTVVPLVAAEPNLLKAALAAPLAKGAKIAVSVTLAPNAKPVQVRYVVK